MLKINLKGAESMNNKKRIFLGIGIFWMALLIGFIGVKEYTLRTGTEVLLKLRPVDPRDLFRGDYVILSYDISNINVRADGEFKENDTIYTHLKLNGNIAEFDGASKAKPSDGLFIAGKVMVVNSNSVRVTYGIESYFVPEGEGRRIERSIKDMYAKIAIGSSGRSVVKSLVRDGKEIIFKK